MMNNEDIIKRYYRGETTVEEERFLKIAFRKGNLADHPMLSFGRETTELPKEVAQQIQTSIHRKARQALRKRLIIGGGIAASLVLLISIWRLMLPPQESLQLSDNMKKERFEDALRVIGKVLEGKNTEQKILYEDSKLIIAIE